MKGKTRPDIRIVYLQISEIHGYENNPRDNDEAAKAVAKSIERFGVRSPAIVDKDNVLIAGHTRIKAAKQLGMTEYPCIRADDLTKAEAKALRLADNRIQEDSSWNFEELRDQFKALKDTGFDLSDTGFSEFEIASIDAPTDFFGDDEYNDNNPEEYDTEEMESGDWEPEDGSDNFPEEQSEYFVLILCCRGEDERQLAAELIGETGPLKGRYTVTQVRKMLEG